MTTIDLAPALDMAEPAPRFTCADRDIAMDTLRRIARSTGVAPDECRRGAFTRYVPGKLVIIYDDPDRSARLYSTTVDGRLAALEAVASWDAERGLL